MNQSSELLNPKMNIVVKLCCVIFSPDISHLFSCSKRNVTRFQGDLGEMYSVTQALHLVFHNQ